MASIFLVSQLVLFLLIFVGLTVQAFIGSISSCIYLNSITHAVITEDDVR